MKWGAAFVTVLLVGCSSSGGTPGTGSSTFQTRYGQDAAAIASHIPGCTGVAAQSDQGVPGITSAATCRIAGHQLIVYGWRNAASQKPMTSLEVRTYAYAEGTGWTAILTDAAPAATQRTIAGQVASALGGQVRTP